ncbi:MAG: protein kinase [Verrucomicrobia bacterium]|nr:protein kinase [Verrucomicrobiota bacterium]
MSQNRYEVLGKIADGGLGSVFKAYDRNLRREVALKRVRAESPEQAEQQAEQLMDEARNLSALQHPHIVTIYDVGRDEEGAYIIMELLKGETLENIIERGALSENDFRELVTQSLEGLVAAHSHEMIHLDIKPQNFMVIWLPSGKFQIKILDFGLAKIASQPTVQEMDEDGAIMGSIFFMAPEQFERAPLDARTDLYSLGCVYYYALTQQYPFQGETGPEVMASHLYHSFIPLAQMRPDLPPFICQWVEWLMNRLPDHRPAAAALAYDVFQTGNLPANEAIQPDGMVYAEPVIESGTSTSPIVRPSAPRASRPGIHRPGVTTGIIGHRPAPKPIIRPVNIASAMAPSHLRHKKPWPKWITLGLPVTIIGIIALVIAIQAIGASRRAARFSALAQMEKPVGSAADVRLLLDFIEQQNLSEEAGKLLGRLQDVDSSNSLIAGRMARVKTAWGKKNLALALAQRDIKEGVDPLLEQLGHTPEPGTRLAIWTALARLGSASNHPAFLDKAKGASPDELRAIESALVNTALSENNPSARGTDVLNALRANSGSDDEQAMLIKALCRIGNKNALPDIIKSLHSTNVKLRYAAALALGDWRTAEPVAALMETLSTEKDTFNRLNAIASLGNLAQLSGDVPQSEIAQALITAYNSTDAKRTQNQVLTSLAKVTDPAAVAFFNDISAKDPRQKAEAAAAVKAITLVLSKVVPVTDTMTTLPADQAILTPGPLTVNDGSITNWLGLDDHVGWLVKIDKPGACEVQLVYSSNSSTPGRYDLTFGRESFVKPAENTGGPANFKIVSIGSASFTKPGLYRLWIRPVEITAGSQLMRVKEATITPGGN